MAPPGTPDVHRRHPRHDSDRGLGVYVDANGQLGSGPVVPAADTVGSTQVIADSLTAADLTFIAGVAGTVLTRPAVQVFVDGNGQLGTLVPAPFTGTIDQPITANPRTNVAALLQTLDEQRALIAALTARVAALEARGPAPGTSAPVPRKR